MNIKKLFLLSFIFLFTACTTKYDLEKKENESITALLLSEDKLYAVGDKNDYQFSGEIVRKLHNFILSPYADRLLYSSAELTITDNKSVDGIYRTYIAAKPFSDAERKELIEKYHFIQIKYLPIEVTNELKKSIELENSDVLINVFRATGELVTLENKQSLNEQYALKTPLIAQTKYFSTGKDVAGDVGAVLMLPVAIIAVVPVMLIWGVACSASHDGC